MQTVPEIVKYINEWIERENSYLERAILRKDLELAHDCHRRIFTLELLLSNIRDDSAIKFMGG